VLCRCPSRRDCRTSALAVAQPVIHAIEGEAMFTFGSPSDQVNYTTEGGPEHAALGAYRRGSPLGDIVAHPTFILLLLPRRDKGIGPRHTANVVYPRRRPPRPSRANLARRWALKRAENTPSLSGLKQRGRTAEYEKDPAPPPL
jgi:hypothetical protein